MIRRYLIVLLVVQLHVGRQLAYSQKYEIDTARIREVVNRWNAAHNRMSKDDFNELYASNVLFYANYLDKKVCVEKKESMLRKHPFEQRLISDLQLTFYEGGTIYCGFSKEVSMNGSNTTYPSYLLLKRFGNRYLITGESDLVTDRNLRFQLSLGVQIPISELSLTHMDREPEAKRDYLTLALILAPVLPVTLIVIYLFRKRTMRNTSASELPRESKSLRLPSNGNQKLGREPGKQGYRSQKGSPDEDQRLRQIDLEKGHAFENFVVDRFRAKSDYFKWIDATSDKGFQDYYPESNLNPDLQYEFRMGGKSYPFSVECKFRSMTSGSIMITKDGQLERYRKFAAENRMDVFIILGLGGTPSNPAELFIIPISEVRQKMERETLHEYKAQPTFYYSTEKRRLY